MSAVSGDREAWLRLALAEDVGPGTLARLDPDPERWPLWLDAGRAELRHRGLTSAQVEALVARDEARLDASRRWLDQPGHALVARIDDDYPPLLRRIADAPVALFVNGDPEWLVYPQIAIVGSRSATANGLAIADQFAGELAAAGLVVTSGLALGIDGAAHAAALNAGGATLAVAGTGPDRVYPARHRDLARRIVDNGAVVSSFAPGIGPRAGHFPARNRIISGMSAGVLVIEAGARSGSLITARLAGEQGRDVFAVPGSIRNPLARGCHRLIREGARLVESAGDVLAELEPMITELAGALRGQLESARGTGGERPEAGDDEADDPDVTALLAAMGHDPVSVDELIARTNLTTQAVSSMLLQLELEGRVAALGGGRYSRTGRNREAAE
jgi:DNA processing protein